MSLIASSIQEINLQHKIENTSQNSPKGFSIAAFLFHSHKKHFSSSKNRRTAIVIPRP